MYERLKRQPEVVYLIVAIYFAAHAVIRLLLPSSLELDEAEQIFLSQWWMLGYGTQPPFYDWMQHTVISVFGTSVLSLTLLKNMMLFLGYLFYGLSAEMMLKNKAWLPVSVLGVLTIPQISFEAQRDLSHTVAVFFAASLFLFGVTRTLKKPSLLSYALAGISIGIGTISKYNFALLVAAMMIAVLADRDFRRRIFDRRLIVTAVAAVLIIAPHAFWFLSHTDLATDGTVQKMVNSGPHAERLLSFLRGFQSLAVAIIGFAGINLLVYLLTFRKDLHIAWRGESNWVTLVGRTMLVSLIIIGIIILSGADNIKDRWLTPCLFLLPLYLSLKLDAAEAEIGESFRIFLRIGIGIMIAIAAILMLRVPIAGMTGHYERPNTDFQTAIEKITESETPGLIVVENRLFAGNARLTLPTTPVLEGGFPMPLPMVQAIDQSRPILLLWQANVSDREIPADLTRWLASANLPVPAAEAISTLPVPYNYGRAGDTYSFGYAWIIPPATGSN